MLNNTWLSLFFLTIIMLMNTSLKYIELLRPGNNCSFKYLDLPCHDHWNCDQTVPHDPDHECWNTSDSPWPWYSSPHHSYGSAADVWGGLDQLLLVVCEDNHVCDLMAELALHLMFFGGWDGIRHYKKMHQGRLSCRCNEFSLAKVSFCRRKKMRRLLLPMKKKCVGNVVGKSKFGGKYYPANYLPTKFSFSDEMCIGKSWIFWRRHFCVGDGLKGNFWRQHVHRQKKNSFGNDIFVSAKVKVNFFAKI